MPVESLSFAAAAAALLVSSFLIRSELLRDNAGDRLSKFWMFTGGGEK